MFGGIFIFMITCLSLWAPITFPLDSNLAQSLAQRNSLGLSSAYSGVDIQAALLVCSGKTVLDTQACIFLELMDSELAPKPWARYQCGHEGALPTGPGLGVSVDMGPADAPTYRLSCSPAAPLHPLYPKAYSLHRGLPRAPSTVGRLEMRCSGHVRVWATLRRVPEQLDGMSGSGSSGEWEDDRNLVPGSSLGR